MAESSDFIVEELKQMNKELDHLSAGTKYHTGLFLKKMEKGVSAVEQTKPGTIHETKISDLDLGRLTDLVNEDKNLTETIKGIRKMQNFLVSAYIPTNHSLVNVDIKRGVVISKMNVYEIPKDATEEHVNPTAPITQETESDGNRDSDSGDNGGTDGSGGEDTPSDQSNG